jgi:serine/threonine protein kinase
MQSGARVQVERHAGVVVARVAGIIDEHFDDAALASAIESAEEPLVVDLDGAPRITSFGVRKWQQAFRNCHTHVFFTNCRPALISQFNSVAQFGAAGAIVTLYCPYVCAACGAYFEMLSDVRKVGDRLRALEAPDATCPKCAAPHAAFDDIEGAYFACLVDRPLSALPSAVAAVIDGVPIAAALRPLRVRKEIAADFSALWLTGDLRAGARLGRVAEGLQGDVVVILDELGAADDEGIEVFSRDVLGLIGARFFLARVPLSLAERIAGDPARLRGAAIVTVAGAEDSRDVVALKAVSPLVEAPPAIASYLAQLASPSATDVGARIGKYEIVRRLGMGGMAEVFLGRRVGPEGFEKKVVIKKILPHLAAQTTFVEQFLEEARVAARLSHPHIVQSFDLGRDNDSWFIVMEVVEGHDFNALIRMSQSLDENIPCVIAARIVAAVCAGLHAAHSHVDDAGVPRPVVHRDVSPHNVLVGFDGTVKIADFGVAKSSETFPQANAGTLKGKVLYMAPEHIRGQPSDQRVDIFAAGVSLYYALVQRHPFARMDEVSALQAVLDAEIPAPRTLRPEVPAELERIVLRAMERDPAKRYVSAHEMAADLERSLASAQDATFADVGAWVRGVSERSARLPVVHLPRGGNELALDAKTVTTPDRTVERRIVVNARELALDDEDFE